MPSAAYSKSIFHQFIARFSDDLPFGAFAGFIARPCYFLKVFIEREVVSDGVLGGQCMNKIRGLSCILPASLLEAGVDSRRKCR